MPRRGSFVCASFFLFIGLTTVASAGDPPDPETAIRHMVRANAEKDLPTLSRLMAHDADIVSYSVGGRKYVGWPEFEQEMREEFINTQKIEIPITELKVWTKGDLAWFTMELDYTRYVGEGSAVKRTVLPLQRNRGSRAPCRPLAIAVLARIVSIRPTGWSSSIATHDHRITKACQ
ncbi:MAG: nuclear transport factor 2 family protein [Nitrospira sp.]